MSYRLLTLNYLLSMYKPAIFYPQTMEEICDLLRGSTKQNYPDKRQGSLPSSSLMSESTFFLLCNQNFQQSYLFTSVESGLGKLLCHLFRLPVRRKPNGEQYLKMNYARLSSNFGKQSSILGIYFLSSPVLALHLQITPGIF